MPSSFNMPSSEVDRKKIMDNAMEISNSMARLEGEKTYIKEAIKALSEEFTIPKGLLTKFVNAYHKQTYREQMGQNEDFEQLVEILIAPDKE